MLKFLSNLRVALLLILLLTFSMLAACSSSDDEQVTIAGPATGPPVEPVTITIGNLSDLTGVSANAMVYINMALEDLVDYYNDNNLISGVELEVITYDGAYDPSRDIPGYEWLREKGADLLMSCPPLTAVSLKPRVNEDQFVLFTATANLEEVTPPGYLFSLGIIPEYCAFTLAEWISENHWDYEAKGPAKIGGAAWTDEFSIKFLDAIEEYAEIHPEQFEYQGAYLNNFSFVWGAEVEELKNCDYVFTPTPPHAFVRQFSEAGHTTTFIGTDTQAAFTGMIDAGDLWDEIDGMLFVRGSQWWNEQGPIIDLTREILFLSRPNDAETIMRAGTGYLSVSQWYQMLEIVKDAVESVGPQNFNAEALYNAAESYSEVLDGLEIYSYGKNKRVSPNYYLIQEASAAERDLVRADPDWLPILTEP